MANPRDRKHRHRSPRSARRRPSPWQTIWKSWRWICSSPYARAQQSVAPLARRLGRPVEIDMRLAERVLSAEPLADWREAIRQTFTELDLTWPGGESSRTAMARGRAAIDALLVRPEPRPGRRDAWEPDDADPPFFRDTVWLSNLGASVQPGCLLPGGARGTRRDLPHLGSCILGK